MSLLMPKLALATRRRGPMLSIDNTLKLPKIAVHRIKHDFKILNFKYMNIAGPGNHLSFPTPHTL